MTLLLLKPLFGAALFALICAMGWLTVSGPPVERVRSASRDERR